MGVIAAGCTIVAICLSCPIVFIAIHVASVAFGVTIRILDASDVARRCSCSINVIAVVSCIGAMYILVCHCRARGNRWRYQGANIM
jgi:hypothetical protein